MKKYLLLLTVMVMVWGCRDKKASQKDEDHIDITDFMEFFPKVLLPYRVADTMLEKRTPDSIAISAKVFTRFIPDSVIKKDFGTAIPRLYPLGRVKERGHETYLFIKAVQGSKRVGYVATFNKDNQFQHALPLVRTGADYATSAYGLLDKKLQLTVYREKKKKGGDVHFKRNVYIFNSAAGAFILILTEPNEEMIEHVIDPIDTLPARHKFSGDYIKNKRNFISVRDGKNNSEILFFVHFEKDNGTCRGELKGNARFISANKALYSPGGNPCTIEFNFTPAAVYMKEQQGCGAYRDIKCFFEDLYPKRKLPAHGKHRGSVKK